MAAVSHKAAIETTLDLMRQRFEAMPPAVEATDAYSRKLTLALHEGVMRELAAVRDGGGNEECFAHAVTHAVSNLIASLASCFTQDDEAMQITAAHICQALIGRTMRRVADPDRDVVIWPAATADPGAAVQQ